MPAHHYEIAVSGRLGPVVRGALENLRIRTDCLTCVVEIVTADPDALWQAIQVLSERGAEPIVLRPGSATTRLG